jgi:hypothetical protein
MPELSGIPYAEVELTKDGAVHDDRQVQALVELAADTQATDLLVIAHGWNNDLDDARRLYTAFFQRFREVLDRGVIPAMDGRRLAILGLLWPSKKFAERTSSQAAPPGSGRRSATRPSRSSWMTFREPSTTPRPPPRSARPGSSCPGWRRPGGAGTVRRSRALATARRRGRRRGRLQRAVPGARLRPHGPARHAGRHRPAATSLHRRRPAARRTHATANRRRCRVAVVPGGAESGRPQPPQLRDLLQDEGARRRRRAHRGQPATPLTPGSEEGPRRKGLPYPLPTQ